MCCYGLSPMTQKPVQPFACVTAHCYGFNIEDKKSQFCLSDFPSNYPLLNYDGNRYFRKGNDLLSRQKKFINKTNIADYAIEAAARCFYPDIVAFYQSEEGQKEFAAWKAEQAALKQQKNERRATAEAVALAVIFASSFVALLAWRREECGSHWRNRLVHNAGKKQIIRTHLPRGRIGSDYIGLVRATGLEPARVGSGT